MPDGVLIDKGLFIFAFPVQLWRQVAEQVLVALFLFQLTMAGLMGSKGVLAQTILIVPLLFITVGAWLISHSVLIQPARVISLRAATDLDRHDQVQDILASFTFLSFYPACLQPSMGNENPH